MSNDSGETRDSIGEIFAADHRGFLLLGREVEVAFAAGALESAKVVWKTLSTSLAMHLYAEEQFMVPALGRAHPRVAHAVLAEHRLIRDRVVEIEASVVRGESPSVLVMSFVFELDAHARHEEKIFCAWRDAWLDEDERALLAAYRDSARSASSAASSSST
ncbi:MAG: hemerythrin domain-containing protein [Polyangiaceae bacterium]